MLLTLGESCHNGPCPTLHQDPETGDVVVQGYVCSRPEIRLPDGEDLVSIPADAWARLLADLPTPMLLRAVVAPWRYRSRARRALSAAGR